MKKLKSKIKDLKKGLIIFACLMLVIQAVVVTGVPAKTMAAVPGAKTMTSKNANIPPTNHVVISEVQVSGASPNDEFVELYNPTGNPVNLLGWRLSKKTSGGTLQTLVNSLSGTIQAYGFFLITPQSGYTGKIAADAVYSQTSTFIANDNTVLLYSDAGLTLVDKVGFGAALDYETAAYLENPSVNQSIKRTPVWQDTNDNKIDFQLNTTADPENSTSTLMIPPSDLTEVTPVTKLTNNSTPSYTFYSSEAGNITYGGDCSSATKAATAGDNTITFNALADGLHNNCTITVTNTSNNGSTLSISSFTVDTTDPTFKATPNPPVAGPGVKTVDITVTSSEALAKAQHNNYDGKSYELMITMTGDGTPTTVYLNPDSSDATGKTFKYTYTIQSIAQNETVSINASGEDLAGNGVSGSSCGTFEVNNLSPVVPNSAPTVTPAVATVTTNPGPIIQNDQVGSSSDQSEVKADNTSKPGNSNNSDDNTNQKKTETKDQKNVPLWGIIFLLILAGIGGYLFYSQSPDKPSKGKTVRKK